MNIDAVVYFDAAEDAWVAHALVLDLVCVNTFKQQAIDDLRDCAETHINYHLRFGIQHMLRAAPEEVWAKLGRQVRVNVSVHGEALAREEEG